MSTLQNRLELDAEMRLSGVVSAAANLTAQLSELNALREMVRKAELSAHHPRPRMEKAAPGVKRAAK
jgi:hypothetical protein